MTAATTRQQLDAARPSGDPAAPLDAAVRERVDDTVEHFNANHADTVLLLARHAAGVVDAVDAEVVAVDTQGIGFDVVTAAGRARVRAAFATPVATVDEVSAAVMGLVGRARAVVAEDVPLTSLERELGEQAEIRTHLGEVRRTRDLTGNLREVVVGGPGLAEHVSVGGDQFLYVMVARPGSALPASYSIAEWIAADPEARPYGAYYTTRRWDPASRELTMWAVVHDHPDGVGAWMATCRPGDRLALWGPRSGYWSEGAYAPEPEPRHHLFVTDESGFAAVAALLDGMADGDAATVLAETIDAEHTVEFPGTRTNVVWHHRGGAEPGTGTGLYDLVTGLVARFGGDSIATAFGAGESRQITQIRKYLRHDIGLPAARVSMTGYWRRTTGTT